MKQTPTASLFKYFTGPNTIKTPKLLLLIKKLANATEQRHENLLDAHLYFLTQNLSYTDKNSPLYENQCATIELIYKMSAAFHTPHSTHTNPTSGGGGGGNKTQKPLADAETELAKLIGEIYENHRAPGSHFCARLFGSQKNQIAQATDPRAQIAQLLFNASDSQGTVSASAITLQFLSALRKEGSQQHPLSKDALSLLNTLLDDHADLSPSSSSTENHEEERESASPR